MQPKLRLLAITLSVILFSFVSTSVFAQATVSTDKLDYPPGATVIITGSGFQPGETVTLQVTHVGDGDNDVSGAHAPWDVVADASGKINATWLVPEDQDELGATLKLTADGKSSLQHAETEFTDALRFKATIALSTGNVGQSQTYTITITNTNTSQTNTKIGSIRISLPSGYSSPTLGTITTSSGTWLYVNTGGYSSGYNSSTRQIGLVANNGSTEIANTGQLSFTVTVTNPSTAGNYEWTTECFSNSGTPFTGSSFGIDNPPGQPTVAISKQNQSITFNNPGTKTYGDADFNLGATASSGLTVGYSIVSGPATIVSGNMLHITGAGTVTVRASQSGDANYNAAPDIDRSFTVNKADATVIVNSYSVTYDGTAHTSTYSITGVNGESGATVGTINISGTTHTNAGAFNGDVWSFTGASNYNNTSGTVDNAIGKADAVIHVTPYDVTYDGVSHTAAFTAVGVESSPMDLSSLMDVSHTTHTNAGDYTADYWSFAGNNNYKAVNNTTVHNKIGKASSSTVITITGAPFTYTGSAITPATVSVTGAGGLNEAPTPNYSSNINAGTATVTYTYAGDDNHDGSSDSKDFTIGKATATVSVNPYSVTYDGLPHTSTYTITGVNGESGATVGLINVSGTTHTNAATYNGDSWSFTGASNYNNASGTVDNAIGTRPVTITVTAGQNKIYGNGDPTFLYSVTSGSLASTDGFSGALTRATGENVGLYNILQAGLTIKKSGVDVSANYNVTYAGTTFEIKSRPITITVNTGQTKVFGTSDPLPFTYAVGGNGLASTDQFTGALSRAAGEDVGNYAIGQGTFSIENSTSHTSTYSNYTVSFTGKDFVITKANANIVVNGYAGVYDANAHGATGTATGVLSENLNSLLHLGDTYTNVPGGTANWTFDGNNNYNAASGSVNIAISKANPAITVTPYVGIYDGNAHTANGNAKGINGENLNAISFTPSYINVPGGAETWTFTDVTGNYKDAGGNTTVTINPQTANPVADAYYTGPSLYWTPNSSSHTATLTLTATIKNNINYTGDIRTAKVSFYIDGVPVTGAQNLPVGLVTTSPVPDLSTGTASAIVQYNMGSATVSQIHVSVKISGNYRDNPDPAYQALVTLAVPTPGGLIVGCGKTCNETSAGYVKGAPSEMTGFSFYVTYNKSLTNQQGGVELYVRSMNDRNGNLTSTLHTYKIKSTSIASLGVKLPRASFSSKANISEIVNGVEQSIEGNCAMQLDLWDANAPGGNTPAASDSLAVTVYRKSGGIWFSNNWVVSSTVLDNICAGDVSATGTGSTSVSSSANPKTVDVPTTVTAVGMNLKAYPNPTASQFNIKLESSNTTDAINIIVYDINGNIVEQKRNLAAGQTIQLGASYRPGIYILEMIQGTEHKQLKLVKIPD